MLRHLSDYLRDRDDFVIKSNRGSAGRDVLVVVGRSEKGHVRHNGELLRPELIRQHLFDILSGMYSKFRLDAWTKYGHVTTGFGFRRAIEQVVVEQIRKRCHAAAPYSSQLRFAHLSVAPDEDQVR